MPREAGHLHRQHEGRDPAGGLGRGPERQGAQGTVAEGGVNEAEFSEGFRYFINIRSTANEPPVTTLHDGRGRLVKTLKDNAKLHEQVARFGWRPRSSFPCPERRMACS